MKTILTHPGPAHRDDFLTTSYLLAVLPAVGQIIRAEPTPEQLEDPDVWVIDVGGVHDPTKNNFDHHQTKPIWDDPACALTLVLQHFGMLDTAREAWPWLRFSEAMDCFGLNGAAMSMNAPDADMKQALSPVEKRLLDRFAAVSVLTEEAPLWDILLDLGEGFRNELLGFRRRLQTLAEFCHTVRFGEHEAVINLMPKDSDAELAYNTFLEKVYPGSLVSVTEDPRGAGWRFYRRRETGVNFTKLIGHSDISFVHQNGFLATTRFRVSEEKIIELLTAAAG